MKDLLNQEIKVGDLVVGGTASSFSNYGKPHVVTRIGSTTKVQLNGASYGSAELLVVVTEQYRHFAGDAAAQALRAEYAEVISFEKVPEQKVSSRFIICWRVKDELIRIFEVKGKTGGEQTKDFYSQVRESGWTMQYNDSYLNYSNNKWKESFGSYRFSCYDRYLFSLKHLKEIGLSEYIGGTFNKDHPVYAIVQSLVKVI